MKKFLSLFALVLVTSLQAQTMLVNDFESGLGGAYVAWGGNCQIIDNPNKGTDNPSNSVLKIVSESYAPVGFAVTIPAGKTLKDYTGIRFQAAVLEGSQNINWIGFNVGVSENLSTMDLVDPTAGNGAAWGDGVVNKWVDVELQFNPTSLDQYVTAYTSGQYNVMIKLGREAFLYAVDNIRLVEKEVVADPNTIFTFESMDLGVSTRCGMPWSGTCSIVENPSITGINSTSKCLQVNGVECSPVTLSGALPSGKQWSEYSGLSFQLCMVSDPNEQRNWGACEVGIRLDNGAHEKIGSAYDESGNETAAYGEAPINQWIPVTLTIKDNLITETANSTGTLYLRLMKNNLSFLIDNIVLSPKVNTGVNSGFSDKLEAYGMKGLIRLSSSEQNIINIYDIYGKKLFSKEIGNDIISVNLPAGIYIVNNKKVIVY